MTPELKVLIVEDDPDIVLGCEQALQLECIATESAPSAEKARARLGRDQRQFRGAPHLGRPLAKLRRRSA